MARALPQGRTTRRRAMFGLFDADGWGWATVKATFWLLVIIMTLGYIPDRAYYFVVSRTIDLGILGWSPVNLCPPENGADMPCPVPGGAIVPWQDGTALPQPRTNGSAAQLGTNLLYIGGSDATDGDASPTTFIAQIDPAAGTFGSWSEGPALPDGRTNAALATLSGTAYLIGGLGPDGEPTDTVWALGLDPDTSELGGWAPVEVAEGEPLLLPEPRAGAAAVAVTDGLIVAGGRGADGTPTSTVWKSTLDDDGVLGAFVEQPSLAVAVADANVAFEGTFLWLYGGSDANGPVTTVQRAQFGEIAGEDDGHGAAEPSPTPLPSGAVDSGEELHEWVADAAFSLPEPRTGASGFWANGAIYLVGGTDGSTARRELYWAVPDATGALPGGWRHLDATDLRAGVENASAVTSGPVVFLLGGDGGSSAGTAAARASLAPEEPFFQLGLVGLTVPGLQIPGEIGQQLGYLAAAGVGTGNFVILVAIAWAFNHQQMLRTWWERRRIAREARVPPPDAAA